MYKYKNRPKQIKKLKKQKAKINAFYRNEYKEFELTPEFLAKREQMLEKIKK